MNSVNFEDEDARRDAVAQRLAVWYAGAARSLPWRKEDTTPWGIIVSEVMAQQTPVARVAPRWEEWMRTWPTPADLADAPTAHVLVAWGNLGYPRRALRLQECAKAIVERWNGIVPDTYDRLVELPGIGDYTAAAVVCFAFGGRSTVIDTNIRRVVSRVFDGQDQEPSSLNAAMRRRFAHLVPEDVPRAVAWNCSVMEFGALICTASNPSCGACPISSLCRWKSEGAPASPRRTPRQTYHGTDRQARGKIMKLLRESASFEAPVSDALAAAVLREDDPHQARRALASLVDDGLVVYKRTDRIALPPTSAVKL